MAYENKANPLATIDGKTYQLANTGYAYGNGMLNNSIPQSTTPNVNGNIWYQGGLYKPYAGSLGNTQQPVSTKQPYKPNQFTQGQLNQFNNGQRGDFENNPAYQQYVAKMQNMYGVSPVGAAGDVLSGQTAFPAGGKTGPVNTGSNT